MRGLFSICRGVVMSVGLGVAAVILLGGCNAPGSAGGLRSGSSTGGWPFVPTAMRIYPLTHIERGDKPGDEAAAKAEGRIITHIDFRDAWGDSTKAKGTLTIFLYGPSGRLPRDGDPPGGNSTQQRRYDVDLTDLKRNAELFDPATRTYRIPLAGLPDWVIAPGSTTTPTLRAEMKSFRADGSSVLMVDEYVVTK